MQVVATKTRVGCIALSNLRLTVTRVGEIDLCSYGLCSVNRVDARLGTEA